MNCSDKFSVFKLLTVYNQHLWRTCRILKILQGFSRFFKIRRPLCQCNVLGIYGFSVIQVNETVMG